MGFDAWFFARLDYSDKEARMANQSMQFVWKPSADTLGDRVSILSHALPDHYHAPLNVRYDENDLEDTDPIIIDPSLETFNADVKCALLREWILDDATHFRTNRLFIPWGDDFNFSNAHLTFANMDRYFAYCNAQWDDITLMYSTVNEYVDALKADKTVTWPVKYDDMFPYADQRDDYWTGFFTSRADAKK